MEELKIPTPAQLLTNLLEMIYQGNEPGPGAPPLTLWENGIHVNALRRDNGEYAIRLEINGRQSRPVLEWRTKDGRPGWHFAPHVFSLVMEWLETIIPREDV